MAEIHSLRAGHPDPFMPAAGRILWLRRRGLILPDRLQVHASQELALRSQIPPSLADMAGSTKRPRTRLARS